MREKLIELLESTVSKEEVAAYGEVYVSTKRIADHLIANGVILDNQVSSSKWIPVSERLPEHFGTFLVAIDEVHGENRVSVDSADFDPYEKSWKTFNYFCAGFKITHWMPLPEPPKEG